MGLNTIFFFKENYFKNFSKQGCLQYEKLILLQVTILRYVLFSNFIYKNTGLQFIGNLRFRGSVLDTYLLSVGFLAAEVLDVLYHRRGGICSQCSYGKTFQGLGLANFK